MDKIRASVGILSFNSGATILRTLESVAEFDDIILVDGGSTDDTLDIAKRFDARIIPQQQSVKDKSGKLVDFGGARNQALDAAHHNWFLYIDSDETISDGLRDDIRRIVNGTGIQDSALVYKVPIGIQLDGVYIRYSSNYPGYQHRFFNTKSGARFIKPVHERIEFNPSVPVGVLTHPWFIHTTHTDWDRYLMDGRRYRDIAVAKFARDPWKNITLITLRNIRAALGVLLRASRNYVLYGFRESIPVRGELGRFLDPIILTCRIIGAKLTNATDIRLSSGRILYAAYTRMPTERAHGLQIMKTCEALARAGKEVELVVPTRKNLLNGTDPFAYYGVERLFTITYLHTPDLLGLGPLGFRMSIKWFAHAVREHMRSSPPILVFSRDEHLLAEVSGPYVWESHTGAWSASARYVALRATKIVVLTAGAKEFYAGKGIDSNQIIVAPDAIDPHDFGNPESKERSRARLNLPNDAKIALYVGGIGGWKGTDTLLTASKLFPDEIVLVIIGGTEEQLLTLRGEYPRIRFLGMHPYRELADNLSAADVLILPNTATDAVSVTFTSPLKLFAYMASGVPMVVSDLPSLREVIDEKSAYLVTPDDAQALTEGILAVLREPAEAMKRAECAKMLVVQYSWEERARGILSSI